MSSVIFFLLITSKQELVPDHLRGVMKAGYWENKVGQYRTVLGRYWGCIGKYLVILGQFRAVTVVG